MVLGANRHMARDGTWVLVVAGGMDLNPDVDPHARTLCLANHLPASTLLENVTSPLVAAGYSTSSTQKLHGILFCATLCWTTLTWNK